MRVGVYVDAFNLYYGGRGHCAASTPGWRWLDIRKLVTPFAAWSGAKLEHIVYCTARVDGTDNPSAALDQSIYMDALLRSGSVDHIEEGRYVSWAKPQPLAIKKGNGSAPLLFDPAGMQPYDPSMPLKTQTDPHLGRDIVLATVRLREEKGSDVNVAVHLISDVLLGKVDAAIVISNDSDLGLPMSMARRHVPVGTINPQKGYLAGALKGSPTDGPGRHWWKQLDQNSFLKAQLPDPVGTLRKPAGW